MNWITNSVLPRIKALVQPKEIPDNFWVKCKGCNEMLFHRQLEENLQVCPRCDYHMPLSCKNRLKALFDDGSYEEIPLKDGTNLDPLKFRDKRKYLDRIKEARSKTGLQDAISLASGRVHGLEIIIAVFSFEFMGGSMGSAVGNAIIQSAELAINKNAPLVIFPSSGGARMQEGILSLMQLPRTIIATQMIKEAELPFIVVLTNPTTGGVTASFAMLGDIHIAEPGAIIGFAGKRVIEETIHEKLPDGFQSAEYLLDHGMVDLVIRRHDLPKTLSTLLCLLMDKDIGSSSLTGE
ncbi:MAG: acetyl-CoA carboxylase, carboxyltransferase subunit beta [Pseudomonadota bacterium]|nr:acetyl-CoA carboxylase, carboxyltransferase subunit beta [Pseudomonadota bacterium]MEC8234678.1 acetyl-CoA carboxylase, carboxyltransferase subunit beta [Pseudomonadota bacterium]